MKLLIILSALLLFPNKDSLVNTVWAYKITDNASNTITFKPNGIALEYDCELNYTFHSTYYKLKDTIVVRGKDDSHSEDGGKVLFYWVTKYLVKGNKLIVIACKEYARGKWSDRKIQPHATPEYVKIK